jgi:hypothetical protein
MMKVMKVSAVRNIVVKGEERADWFDMPAVAFVNEGSDGKRPHIQVLAKHTIVLQPGDKLFLFEVPPKAE